MWLTISPISSIWPITASVGPPPVPRTRATDEPTTSRITSSANDEQDWRNTVAADDS